MTEYIQTVVVGGGQAGAATSYWLAQREREHLVLEQDDQPGSSWRHDRWDSFTLVTPNRMIRLPGAEYSGQDPDGFLPRAEIVAYLAQYVARFKLPFRFNERVTGVEPEGDRYRIFTGGGEYTAQNVVIATGFLREPTAPAYSLQLPPGIRQLHSGRYRNPDELPAGAILVVGSGQSGAQIAEELYQTGRKVYLCVGSAPRIPRRYRGRDITSWLDQLGFFDRTEADLPSPQAKLAAPPHVSGKNGGHSLNLHLFARHGVVLLGHIRGVRDGLVGLAPDLFESLRKVDQFEVDTLRRIDNLIVVNRLSAPEEAVPQVQDGYASDLMTELDLEAAGVTSVIWAMGYRPNYAFVKLPVFDPSGIPVQDGGRTAASGLYFAGVPWSPKFKHGLLFGVGEQAALVASQIAGRTD